MSDGDREQRGNLNASAHKRSASPSRLPVPRGDGSRSPSPFSDRPGTVWEAGQGDGGDRLEGVAGEGERWHQAMPALEDRLREFGYDIEPTQSGAPPSSIVARRDLGDRAVVIAIDAGGRFRAMITWVVGEWPSRDEIAGVPVRVVDAVSRTVTVTGQLEGPEQVAEVVTSLRAIAPWASVEESEPPLPET